MKKSIYGIIKLFRFNEYVYIILITSMLGVASSQGSIGGRFIILTLANLFAVSFVFMFNDIEDAPLDALSASDSNHNPIATGLITPKTAKLAAGSVAILSAAFFVYLGFWPLLFGLGILILGYFYSCRGFKLRSMIALDIFSNSLMLAGLPFLCAYFTYATKFTHDGFWPFVFVMSLSLYISFYYKLRRPLIDSNLSQNGKTPGFSDRSTNILMILILVIGVVSGAVTLFIIEIIPFWVYGIIAILTILFIFPAWLVIRKGEQNLTFHLLLLLPLTRATAIALALQHLLPWFTSILRG